MICERDMSHQYSERSCSRPEIDGLRALAVTAVIINHFDSKLLPSGYLGVDCFFVISGFVITSSLSNRSAARFADFFAAFYARRIKRLVPALVLCVFVTGVLICFFQSNPGFSLKTGIASLFGLSNLYLYRQSTNYFSQPAELNVFTQTWSLAVEEQFYLFFPLVVWLSGFARIARGARKLFWMVLGFSVPSLLCFVHLNRTNEPAAYFLVHARLWELGCGSLIFLGEQLSPSAVGIFPDGASTPIFIALIALLFAPRDRSRGNHGRGIRYRSVTGEYSNEDRRLSCSSVSSNGFYRVYLLLSLSMALDRP